jgi:hypothetical protein
VLLNYGAAAAFPSAKFGPLQDEQAAALLTMFQTIVAAPALHIPLGVLDLITERMASILQLDVDQVHDALVSTATQRAEQLQANPPPGLPPETAGALGGLQGMANAGVAIANRAAGRPQGASMRPPPPPPAGRPGVPPAKPPQVPPPGRLA